MSYLGSYTDITLLDIKKVSEILTDVHVRATAADGSVSLCMAFGFEEELVSSYTTAGMCGRGLDG